MPTSLYRISLPLALAVLGACAPARRTAAPEPPPPPPPPAFTHQLVWTARPNVPLHTDAGVVTIRHPLVRFDVLEADTLGLRVRCARCDAALEGWISLQEVIYTARSPSEARHGTLAEFALAVREAALYRNLAALQPVMSRDFTFSFGGGGGPLDAIGRWEWEGFRSLSQLPALLDRGLATRDSVIWSAPPEFVTDENYHGLRAGFRHSVERGWEWIYLVRGD